MLAMMSMQMMANPYGQPREEEDEEEREGQQQAACANPYSRARQLQRQAPALAPQLQMQDAVQESAPFNPYDWAAYARQLQGQPLEEQEQEEEEELEQGREEDQEQAVRVNPYFQAWQQQRQAPQPYANLPVQSAAPANPYDRAIFGRQTLAALQEAQQAAVAADAGAMDDTADAWGDASAIAEPLPEHLEELVSTLRLSAASSGGPTRRSAASSTAKQAFGFRGDSLILTRLDGVKNRKFKSFQTEVEQAFLNHFGARRVNYESSAGSTVKQIARTIETGPQFDVLCVGLGINDLLNTRTEQVLANYPPKLDEDLQALAEVVQEKSTKSLFLLSGAASIWNYPPVWDEHISRVHVALVLAGATVVPADEGSAVMSNMPVNSDGMHFLHDDDARSFWAEAWAHWLKVYAGVTDPDDEPSDAAGTRSRSRSRGRAR